MGGESRGGALPGSLVPLSVRGIGREKPEVAFEPKRSADLREKPERSGSRSGP
jgi:hypothetical protein